MTTVAVFAGVEAPPDPVDWSLCDALMVALPHFGSIDVASVARALRGELRRMDIELVPVMRLAHARRLSDLVRLQVYTQALAQRNAALREIERLRRAPPIDDLLRQVEDARALAETVARQHADALSAKDADIARIIAERDALKPIEGR